MWEKYKKYLPFRKTFLRIKWFLDLDTKDEFLKGGSIHIARMHHMVKILFYIVAAQVCFTLGLLIGLWVI